MAAHQVGDKCGRNAPNDNQRPRQAPRLQEKQRCGPEQNGIETENPYSYFVAIKSCKGRGDWTDDGTDQRPHGHPWRLNGNSD